VPDDDIEAAAIGLSPVLLSPYFSSRKEKKRTKFNF
jgi:hypothetical protein